MRHTSLCLFAALSSIGCGSVANDACKSMAASCIENQMACAVDSSGKAACVPCGAGQYAAKSGACEAIGGTALVHDFATFDAMPGGEILGLCQSWTLNNATEVWVNAVELTQHESSHHSNWMFVPSDKYPGPDGVWSCADRSYHQRDAALAGGVLYAQSTQAVKEVQKFPNGAAIRIPPNSKVIGDVHILNATNHATSGRASLIIYTVSAAEAKVKLVPFHLDFAALAIPPHASSRFSGECDIYTDFQSQFGTPVQMKVYYLLPHTHAMGKRFFLEVYKGPDDGKSLIDVRGFNGDARGRGFDPPFDMAGADGFRFGCEYDNGRDQTVGWGFGDQEMCEILGFADSPLAFESLIVRSNEVGSEGTTRLFKGPCTTFSWKWDPNKPGGPSH